MIYQLVKSCLQKLKRSITSAYTTLISGRGKYYWRYGENVDGPSIETMKIARLRNQHWFAGFHSADYWRSRLRKRGRMVFVSFYDMSRLERSLSPAIRAARSGIVGSVPKSPFEKGSSLRA